MPIPEMPANVAAVFASYPTPQRAALKDIRKIIFQVAGENPIIGTLTETLKWNEPAYLTEQTKSGTTVRIAAPANTPDRVGLFLNCKTTLIDTMREIYPDAFTYQGTRAALVDITAPLPRDALAHSIEMALTYKKSMR